MQRDMVWPWLYATLTVPLAVGATLTGCASGPEPTGQPNSISRSSAALSGGSCAKNHAISLESPKSRCASIPGRDGRWLGRRAARIENRVYCSYTWIPATSSTGTTPKPAPVRKALLPTKSGGVAVKPAAAFVRGVPLLAVRPAQLTVTTPTKATKPANPDKRAKPQNNGAPPDLSALKKNLQQFEIDCPVTTPLAPVGPSDPAWQTSRLDTHRAQTGWIKELPASKVRVRVAVVDSAARPYTSSATDNSDHGRAAGRVAGDLGCPLDGAHGACPVEIVNHLALPMIDEHTADYTRGGYFGTRGQLATALNKAIDAWLSARDRDGAQRLVINLSLGWSSKHGGALDYDYRDLDLSSQPVYAAIARASCHGALIIAAAGNCSTPGDKDPMYPGGWESVPAPYEKQCEEFGWRNSSKLPIHDNGKYRPLVYAVGGVDAHDQPLSNTRPGGQARLVGHAMTVVATDPLRGGWTATLTGSSMSAAVASGVAAAAWSYLPHGTAHQLMNLVYETSVELNPNPIAETELCLNVGEPCAKYPIRRISACETLGKVLGVGPSELGCETIAAHGGAAKAPGKVDTSAFVELAKPGPACAGGACGKTGLIPDGDEPWTKPQPGDPSCHNCFLLRAAQHVFVGLKPGIAPTLSSVMVHSVGYSNNSVHQLLPGAGNFPQYFAAQIPHSGDAFMAKLIMVHSVGFTSLAVDVSAEEPIPVF